MTPEQTILSLTPLQRRVFSLAPLLLVALLGAAALAQAPGTAAAGPGAAVSSGPATGQAGQGNGANGNNGVNGVVNGNNGRNANQTTRGNRENEGDRRVELPAGTQDLQTEFQQLVAATTGRSLPIFGASLFGGVPSTFAPVEDVPVGPGYVIGPGDELRLQLSGQVNQQLDLVVDRTGAISVPGLGAVHVAGVPYGQLTTLLNNDLGRIYRNYSLDMNLGALRTIQVFVMGEARRPGAFSISSLSTLTNAVFASGGALPQGSLRDIQVNRGGKVIDHFDLYDLLLHGDKTHDISLMNGDVILIPPAGPQVAVVGSVNNSAIYELKGETTVQQVLDMAGGVTSVAATASVRLERVYEHSMLSVRDVNMAQMSGVPLQNGDIVSVTSIIDRFRDAVTLRGNVANPGRYVWRPGMRISDLIPNKEALITRGYWRKRNELGQLAQDYVPENPSDPLQGEGALGVKGNASTESADNIAQRGNSNTSNQGGSSVGVALTGNNSVFSAKTDVILSAPDIYWNYAVIERQSTKDLTTSLIPFDLGKIVLLGDPSQNYELLPGDVITIFSKSDIRVPSQQQTRFVRLEGEFVAAGVYSVLPGETLRGLLRRVGGFTPDAYLYASEFTRESTRRVQEQRLREYTDQLEAQISASTASAQARALSASDQYAANASAADARTALGRLRQVHPIGRIVLELKPNSAGIDSVPDLALEDGDRFIVPRVPSNITVEGQVYNANAFVYIPGERAIDYMHKAGGPDREADKRRTFILRADGSVVSRQYSDVNRAFMYPGDTLVVPPVIDKRSPLQRIVELSSIISSTAFSFFAFDYITR